MKWQRERWHDDSIADYFGLEPTLVRVGWVLFVLAGGSGILAYIIAMVIMPERPDHVDDL
ncbi:MAG: PspC domain-containing protein [Spirochaetota bacterium]